jgi:hypothetical protein
VAGTAQQSSSPRSLSGCGVQRASPRIKVVEKDAAKDGWAEGPPLFSFTGTEGGVVYG